MKCAGTMLLVVTRSVAISRRHSAGVEARHDHDRRADEEMLRGVGVRHRVVQRARDQVHVVGREAPHLDEALLRLEPQLAGRTSGA